MSPHRDLPPGLGDEPFGVKHARELGVRRGRLAGSDLARPYRGVRVAGDPPASVEDLARAYYPRMPNTQVFSHVTAAILHSMPLPLRWQADRRLHISSPSGDRPPQVRGVVGHQYALTIDTIEFCRNLPVTTPLQTWIHLGSMLRRVDLVIVADFLCAGRTPSFTPERLRLTAAGIHGQRGCRGLREAAALARARVDSPKETETRLLLVDAGLPEPIVNFEVADARGRFLGRVDLAWPAFRVCVEYEGDGHRTSQRQFRLDITRRESLEDAGWRVLRVTQDNLLEPQVLVRRVRAALNSRGARL
ncbi:hypothetical protein D6T64_07265 [Cryobacterium melibiosiphilum]|uniref:DUF559 domain-containing protein n=1 Tax=Cryobacterium melibiosiphilum TaxID=995039 RepID=A0A3A5MJZ3_9MICO|nr:hypothetical protein [Cryobacterium melibiosiphilum]RJT89355.1 hypothetical protein D6T64_07265 [Cryobacterium melibiosiphilum]